MMKTGFRRFREISLNLTKQMVKCGMSSVVLLEVSNSFAYAQIFPLFSICFRKKEVHETEKEYCIHFVSVFFPQKCLATDTDWLNTLISMK